MTQQEVVQASWGFPITLASISPLLSELNKPNGEHTAEQPFPADAAQATFNTAET